MIFEIPKAFCCEKNKAYPKTTQANVSKWIDDVHFSE